MLTLAVPAGTVKLTVSPAWWVPSSSTWPPSSEEATGAGRLQSAGGGGTGWLLVPLWQAARARAAAPKAIVRFTWTPLPGCSLLREARIDSLSFAGRRRTVVPAPFGRQRAAAG